MTIPVLDEVDGLAEHSQTTVAVRDHDAIPAHGGRGLERDRLCICAPTPGRTRPRRTPKNRGTALVRPELHVFLAATGRRCVGDEQHEATRLYARALSTLPTRTCLSLDTEVACRLPSVEMAAHEREAGTSKSSKSIPFRLRHTPLPTP
jgi:hypothetical protein